MPIKNGDWLKESMRLAGITEQELSDRSGVSRSMIARMKAGTRVGSAEIWRRLIDAMGVAEEHEGYDGPALIERIEAAIAEKGADTACKLVYRHFDTNIVFVDFADADADVKGEFVTATLGQALDFVKSQA